MRLKGWLLILCSLCGYVLPAAAQLPLPAQPIWVHYSSRNSDLPTELIYKIIADKNGYLWLASDRGLIRYDGQSFRTIAMRRTEDFVSVFKTRDDILWLFAFSGYTAGVDLKSQQIINTDSLYGLDRIDPPTGPYLLGIEAGREIMLYRQGSKGKATISLPDRRSTFQKMNRAAVVDDLLTRYRIPDNLPGCSMRQELDSMFLHNAYGISAKDSFITLRNKIFIIRNGAPATLYFNGDEYGIGDYVMGFARRGNDLYIGGQTLGLRKICGYFSMPRRQQSIAAILPGERVNYVETDYLNNIWVSSYGNGLFFFPAEDQDTRYYNKAYSGLYSDDVTHVNRFPNGVTAVGYAGAVIEYYRPSETGPVRYRLPVTKYPGNVLHTVVTRHHWLAFTGAEAFHGPADSHRLPDRFKVTPFRRHVGLAPGYKHGGLLGQAFYYASSNGLVRIDSTGRLSWYPGDTGAFPQKRISLLAAADTQFFIGTIRGCYLNTSLLPYLEDAQINVLDRVADRLVIGTNIGVYTVSLNNVHIRDSLRNVYTGPCYAIRHDTRYTYILGAGELVILHNGTQQILSRFSFRKYRIPFRLTDFCTAGDYITLAGNMGIFCIPKERIVRQRQSATPKIHVLCSLDGYSPADSVFECRYRNGLAAVFELDILDYRDDDRKITYRLFRDGEELFHRAGIREHAQVNFQPPGPGVYQIMYDIGGEYPQPERTVSYRLIVTPLWYQRWWCRLLLCLAMIAGFLYALYRFYRFNTALERRKLEQQLHLQELEAQSLFGQLKPHFIFNVLTPLQGYLIRDEKLEGLNYLESFSRLMRGLLTSIRDKYAPLRTELEFVQHYLQLQQRRFGNCFQYRVVLHLSQDPGTYRIPTLLIQPIVENAVEHGIDKHGNNGLIEICISESESTLRIDVTDNGTGLPPGFRLAENHALRIISERMELMAKMNGAGALRIGPRPDGQAGTCVTLILAKTP